MKIIITQEIEIEINSNDSDKCGETCRFLCEGIYFCKLFGEPLPGKNKNDPWGMRCEQCLNGDQMQLNKHDLYCC